MKNPLPHCVYILFSQKDHLWYTGYTSKLKERIKDHNSGKTTSTSSRVPLILIFCEFYLFKQDALNREKYFKTSSGKRALKFMLNTTFQELGYKNHKIGFEFCRGN